MAQLAGWAFPVFSCLFILLAEDLNGTHIFIVTVKTGYMNGSNSVISFIITDGTGMKITQWFSLIRKDIKISLVCTVKVNIEIRVLSRPHFPSFIFQTLTEPY